MCSSSSYEGLLVDLYSPVRAFNLMGISSQMLMLSNAN